MNSLVQIPISRRANLKRCVLSLVLLLGLSGFRAAPEAALHPFHITFAEAEMTEDEQSGLHYLEVALRITPEELEEALEIREEKHINIETTPNVDEMIAEYLRDVFIVRKPGLITKPSAPLPPAEDPCADWSPREKESSQEHDEESSTAPPPLGIPERKPPEKKAQRHPPRPLRWVGKEVTLKETWLYFEICLPDGIEGMEFSNRILFELDPAQTNTLNLKQGDKITTLRFNRQSPRKIAQLDAATPKRTP